MRSYVALFTSLSQQCPLRVGYETGARRKHLGTGIGIGRNCLAAQTSPVPSKIGSPISDYNCGERRGHCRPVSVCDASVMRLSERTVMSQPTPTCSRPSGQSRDASSEDEVTDGLLPPHSAECAAPRSSLTPVPSTPPSASSSLKRTKEKRMPQRQCK